MRRLLSASLVSACAVLCAAPVHADTLQLNSYTYGAQDVSVHVSGGATPDFSYSGGAGEFSGTLNGAPFQTYCLDLYQEFYWGTTYTNYTPAALAPQVAQDLGRLVTKYRSSVDDAETTTAFQLATWEILYENPANGYNLNNGVFTETANADARNLANAWLGDLGTVSNVNVQVLYSDANQDFLLTSPVPEPSSYAMLVAGLGLLGWTARRQRRG